MKHKQAIILTAIVSACLVAFFLLGQAGKLWSERKQLVAQSATQQQLVAQSKMFAHEHNDYAAYELRQKQKLAQLERALAEKNDTNRAMRRLQALAMMQKVQLASIEQVLATKEHTAPQIRISMRGDFFQLLRWLRQVERAGFNVCSFTAKNAPETQNVQLELLIELHKTNL